MRSLLRQVCPAFRAGGIAEVTPEFLAARGIDALILDLDNTLVYWHAHELPPSAEEWLGAVRAQGVRLCLLSNTHRPARVRRLAEALGVECVLSGRKPLRGGFIKAMARMGTTAETTAVIGDQLLTDIWGGNRCGLLTILVAPMSPVEFWGTKVIHRSLERLLFARFEQHGLTIERIGEPQMNAGEILAADERG